MQSGLQVRQGVSPGSARCLHRRIEVPCKLVEVSAHLAALGKQSGNSGQGFFAAACNDDRFLNLDVVDGAADESGEGEIQEFASEFQ